MGQNDEPERETWTGKLDFLLSCIGYAVGLGNIWRFPYLCYRNGGGAFLVPYVIMLIICGIPIFFMELSLGQFASEGPITVWKINPLFYGVGWAMVTICAMVCIYYNVVIMYALYYLFVSFVSLDHEVPWKTCNNTWNTYQCRQEAYPDFKAMTNETEKVLASISVKTAECVNTTFQDLYSGDPQVKTPLDVPYSVMKDNFSACDIEYKTPSDEYFTRYVLGLNEANGIGDLGDISLKNILCLLLAWIVIFFCLMKGIKTSGKVVYFTATFPYLILIVLLVRGVTLPGYMEGIEFYIIPKWGELANAKVWQDAATQIFYSVGVAFGSLIAMSSYNKFTNNVFRDALLVTTINCSTSIFGGFAIFSLLGYMAHKTNQDVADVADSGPGLIFVAYPEGIARLPVSSLWAFLFFFMVVTLGLDSQFAMMETVLSGLIDSFPRLLRKHKTLFTLICCLIGFVLGIPQTTRGGMYVLTLFDWYSAGLNLMIASLFEIIAVMWLYGFRNFIRDIEMMIGKKPWPFWIYWVCMWVVISPSAILFIVIMSSINYTEAYYGDYTFPGWAQGLGWMMVAIPLGEIFICAIWALIKYRKNPRDAIRATKHWGPRLPENRAKDERYSHTSFDNLGYQNDVNEKSALPPYQQTDMSYPHSQRF